MQGSPRRGYAERSTSADRRTDDREALPGYRCPAGKQLVLHHWTIEHEMKINVYYASGCQICALKRQCTTGTERRVRRCEHEAGFDAMQKRLDRKPDQMKVR
jgi:hypothetical protein